MRHYTECPAHSFPRSINNSITTGYLIGPDKDHETERKFSETKCNSRTESDSVIEHRLLNETIYAARRAYSAKELRRKILIKYFNEDLHRTLKMCSSGRALVDGKHTKAFSEVKFFFYLFISSFVCHSCCKQEASLYFGVQILVDSSHASGENVRRKEKWISWAKIQYIRYFTIDDHSTQ